MERRPLLAGNWKMHTTIGEAEQLAKAVAMACEGLADRDVMIAPPFTALAAVGRVLTGTPVLLGAQNIHWEEKGAYTGEISPLMLKDTGGSMAIVGHSERRHIFHEDDTTINRRLTGAMAHGITPVFCIGETLTQREAGTTMAVLEAQVRAGLVGIELTAPDRLVIAYEPVWAIGTGKTATEMQAQEIHTFLRRLLGSIFEKNIAAQLRILYGGSVKPDNIDRLMQMADIDGVLVGGAALAAESFKRIIHFSGP